MSALFFVYRHTYDEWEPVAACSTYADAAERYWEMQGKRQSGGIIRLVAGEPPDDVTPEECRFPYQLSPRDISLIEFGYIPKWSGWGYVMHLPHVDIPTPNTFFGWARQ